MGFEDEREHDDNDYGVSEDARKRAHKALDQWLNEVAREGLALRESGTEGLFARFDLTAVAEDVSIDLKLQRSIEEAL